MAKRLKYLVLHCTATPEGRAISADDIKRWHLQERKWRVVGYHYLIALDGTIVQLHEHNDDDLIDNWEITNGVKGFNSQSIHIVYAGGCAKTKPKNVKWYPPKDTRTLAQKKAMEQLVKRLVQEHTSIKVCGHNQLANKACPSFNVSAWCEKIGLLKKNIY